MDVSSQVPALLTTVHSPSVQPAPVVASTHLGDVTPISHTPASANAVPVKTLHEREKVTALSGNTFSLDLLTSLEASRREAGGPEQQMAELEDQYHAYLGETLSSWQLSSRASRFRRRELKKALESFKTGTRLTEKERSRRARLQRELDALTNMDKRDLSDRNLHEILKSCCKPELARLIPDDMLDLLKNWLDSPYSVLETSRQALLKVLNSPEELRKVIRNNPSLANGDLFTMDDVVFRRGSKLTISDSKTNYWLSVESEELDIPLIFSDYSNMSFQRAIFPDMHIRGSFRNCDFSYADFTGSTLCINDFYRSDLTAANFSKCYICSCDFHKATLTGTSFGDIRELFYNSNERFEKTVTQLSQALIDYSRRTGGDSAVTAIRALAKMLVSSKRLTEAEAAYDELLHMQRMNIEDFCCLGQACVDAADALDPEDRERADLLEKALAYFQKGWRVTDNCPGDDYDHDRLFLLAIRALGKTGPAFDGCSVLEDIKSSGTKDTRTLIGMAETLAAKQKECEAISVLLQLVSTPEHFHHYPYALNNICKTASQLGLRNPGLLPEVLMVLESATAFAQDIYDSNDIKNPKKLKLGEQYDIFAVWLYRLDLLVQYGRLAEASELAFEMDKAIPESLKLFSKEDYRKSAAWCVGADSFFEIIEKIHASGVIFAAGDDLSQIFGKLSM